MKYYVFKVKDSLNGEYFVLNNQHIGYVGFDCQFIRSILEYNANIKRKYQCISVTDFIMDNCETDRILHKYNCESKRFNKKEIISIIKKYKFKKTNDKRWYEIYYPFENSSHSVLREIVENKNVAKIIS
jgi:hypothetical protein